jgi:hypothetical protein
MPVSPAHDPVLKRFRMALEALYGDRIERVGLFGSRARGEAREESDYDVAVCDARSRRASHQSGSVLGPRAEYPHGGNRRDAGRNAYLAAFHAAQALIAERTGRDAKTHKGVHTQFARLTQNEPSLGRELRQFLVQAYDLKSVADYGLGPDTARAARSRPCRDRDRRTIRRSGQGNVDVTGAPATGTSPGGSSPATYARPGCCRSRDPVPAGGSCGRSRLRILRVRHARRGQRNRCRGL